MTFAVPTHTLSTPRLNGETQGPADNVTGIYWAPTEYEFVLGIGI